MNNYIQLSTTLYEQLCTMLCEKLRTIVHKVISTITYNCLQHYVNNHVQLSTMLCEQLRTIVNVFSMIVQSYVTLEQRVARCYYNWQYYVAILRVGKTIKILTGSTKYQGIDGYLPSYPDQRMDIFVNSTYLIYGLTCASAVGMTSPSSCSRLRRRQISASCGQDTHLVKSHPHIQFM